MDNDADWSALLKDHPIFSHSPSAADSSVKAGASLELSLGSLCDFTKIDPQRDGPAPSGRRQVMIIKDSELIVAVGHEIRMTTLSESRFGGSARNSYKILHTPNLEFDIHEIALSPHGKLLVVAGAFQVAVVVLPRAGFTKLVPSTIDCKCVQVGQFYHAADTSPPIAKIEWHPWGEGGTTLMVMTTDGKLREYDISRDTEEPQQVLSFVPEKKKNSYIAVDESEREVASFTLGKGRADWGPLTVYAIMKSGDIYAICPYMPRHAEIPSSYVHSLECFVSSKQQYLSRSQDEGSHADSLSDLYEHQHKYVSALVKQLPPGTVYPAAPRTIRMYPPTVVKNIPVRQGPFLLQPSPRSLEGSDGGDATDIAYMAFGSDIEEEFEGETERLGVIVAAFQDGRVDVYLDVEKVEARWEHKKHPDSDLPMLAVYETIDLGIVDMLSKVATSTSESALLDLIQANHPVFLSDPIHDDMIYVYHAFGVHALQLGPVLRSLAHALRNVDNENDLQYSVQDSAGTDVQPILLTFSIERKSSNPVIGVSIPDDVYPTYSIFILTSTMRIEISPLNLRSDMPFSLMAESPSVSKEEGPFALSLPAAGPPAYISLLGLEPYTPPSNVSKSSSPRVSLPPSLSPRGEFMVTPDTLRYLGTVVERITRQLSEINVAYHDAVVRQELQKQEFDQQREKCKEMFDLVESLKGPRVTATKEKIDKLKEAQNSLMARMDRTFQLLMKQASPELSESETKWFEELRSMKAEVAGVSKYDENSLAYRIRLLQREVDRLLPQLKEMKEKERLRKNRLLDSGETLGVSQAFELGKRTNTERAKIDSIENEIMKLAAKLDVTLGRPPQLQGPAIQES
ncbi:uncharacterized protein LAESUDRAFT_668845 [Laetiporus sulphureus 93-53]|uniref:Nucleoporin nup82 n=1 Tax=Laetiporus sulphureus 93-53 TaxID=1314785 RepID=A0A165IB10_9APHY|nr:uncharacterized protein LAESUDRAFT_668845 [Laetiporus sulphureus 93-53]KZT12830.1 hypothetical protein LAESUDRAFT_668845 [Laetiporus sulphureus 93-53]